MHETDVDYFQQFVVVVFVEIDIRMVDIVDVVIADVVVDVDVEFVVEFVVVAVAVVADIVGFAIAFVVVVAVTLYYLHSLKTFVVVALAANIVASIGCPIFVTVDFLFPQHYELVPILVACQTYLVDLREWTTKGKS